MAWAAIIAGALKGAMAEDDKGNQESAKMSAAAASKPMPTPASAPVSLTPASAAPVMSPQTATPLGGLLNPAMPNRVNAAPPDSLLPPDLHAQAAAAAADAAPTSAWDRIRKSKGAQGLMGFMQGATGSDY